MKKALITGITGQDGTYLTNFLLAKGYQVIGVDIGFKHFEPSLTSPNSTPAPTLIEGSVQDIEFISNLIITHTPDEIYNFASISFIPASWEDVNLNIDINGKGAVNLLEIVRKHSPHTRIFQPSSSEMFGNPVEVPQTIDTPIHPNNPYAAAKAFAHHMIGCYRDHFNIFATAGILFNHESPIRPPRFVTRKITSHAVQIKLGKLDTLPLGNLDAQKDWGFAGDYVKAMWMMLQAETPQDYVIGTGKLHSVRDVCKVAFELLDLDYEEYVTVDPRFYRKEINRQLLADPTRIRTNLGWEPDTDFISLIKMMVEHDLELETNNPA